MNLSRTKQILRTASIDRLVPLLIAAIIFVTFYPTLHAFFVDDDYILLEFSGRAGLTLSSFFSPYLNMPIGVFLRPVTLTFFVAFHSIFGLHVSWYHTINLMLHCANACLIYVFAKSRLEKGASRLIPLSAAAVFAVHPRVTDVVGLINSLPDLLCTFFMLTSLILFTKQMRVKNVFHAFFFGVSFILALFSKEVAVITPILIVILWIGEEGATKKLSYLRMPLLLSFGLELVYFMVRFLSVHHFGIGKTAYANYDPIHLFAFFLKGIVAFFLPAEIISLAPPIGTSGAQGVCALLVILLTLGVFYAVWKRAIPFSPLFRCLTLIACALVCLAPASFYEFSLRTMKENRFAYLPFAFFAIGSVSLAGVLSRREKPLAIILAGLIVILSLFSRSESEMIARAGAVSKEIYENLGRLSPILQNADEIMVLDAPRIFEGVPVGVPKEGIALSISTADTTPATENGRRSLAAFMRATNILSETTIGTRSDGAPVDWSVSSDSLVGTMKDSRNSFLHLPEMDTLHIPHVQIGISQEDSAHRTFQRITIFPISSFSSKTVLLSCGIGKIRVIGQDTNKLTRVNRH